ncbi:MAG TPA: hypothetical protein VF869_09790 [Jatrophihabitantaceae bacterium]
MAVAAVVAFDVTDTCGAEDEPALAVAVTDLPIKPAETLTSSDAPESGDAEPWADIDTEPEAGLSALADAACMGWMPDGLPVRLDTSFVASPSTEPTGSDLTRYSGLVAWSSNGTCRATTWVRSPLDGAAGAGDVPRALAMPVPMQTNPPASRPTLSDLRIHGFMEKTSLVNSSWGAGDRHG